MSDELECEQMQFFFKFEQRTRRECERNGEEQQPLRNTRSPFHLNGCFFFAQQSLYGKEPC